MNEEDAFKYIVHIFRHKPVLACPTYGYDIYLPATIRHYVQNQELINDHRIEERTMELSPEFYSAAWELCRRGIIRPGIRKMGEQSTSDGSAGNGYSITPFGHTWISESELDDYIVTEPGRFGKMVEPYRELYGPGFYDRSQQAIRCYGAHAYLACCAMCGAACESIMLAVAIKKSDEETVLDHYRKAGGRKKVENLILGKAKQQLRQEFIGYTVLLNYWRDEAAHGRASSILDNEAYTSLALLLRFAQFVRDNWEQLSGEG